MHVCPILTPLCIGNGKSHKKMSAYKDNFIKNIKEKLIIKINAPHTKTEEKKNHI
jgi:hypothetical protein